MTTRSLLSRAADVVCEHRSGSVALLQRVLCVDHATARTLTAQLASRGLLEAPNPDGRYRYAATHQVQLSNRPAERHARAMRDVALYVLETGVGMDSRCIGLILHPLKCNVQEIKAVAATLGAERKVLELARAFSELPTLRPPLDAIDGFEQTLEDVCAGAEPSSGDAGRSEEAAYMQALCRAVRYLDKRLHDGFGPHSRCFDYFVPMRLIPQGDGLEGDPTYCEHVVPCVLLCAEATRMLRGGIDIEEVAAWLAPYLRIVWIDPRLADRMDHELKLKTKMPKEWSFGQGCTYARLHAADILFTPPKDGPECCGWDITRHLDESRALMPTTAVSPGIASEGASVQWARS